MIISFHKVVSKQVTRSERSLKFAFVLRYEFLCLNLSLNIPSLVGQALTSTSASTSAVWLGLVEFKHEDEVVVKFIQ